MRPATGGRESGPCRSRAGRSGRGRAGRLHLTVPAG